MKSPCLVILKPREENRALCGHPWIYDNEIARVETDTPPSSGAEVIIKSSRGVLLGSGLWSPSSKIRVRLHSFLDERCDSAFIAKALAKAMDLRARSRDLSRESCRLIFGEADSLPGLIVDMFRDTGAAVPGAAYLSVQILSAGMDARREIILDALENALQPAGIIERSDAPVRALEGLPNISGLVRGSVPERITIEENGLLFRIDLSGGQKTGWFLDQKDNRAAASGYAKDKRVLDVFCNAGGFSICAAAAGARSILALDSSADALEQLLVNAKLNGFEDRISTENANAFDRMREIEKSGARFGLIILDPPAFAKNRAAIQGAHRGYKEINLRALKLLEPGGVLVTFSCSYWYDRELFRHTVQEASGDAGVRVRILQSRTQSPDHPILLGYQESEYLKCLILEAI